MDHGRIQGNPHKAKWMTMNGFTSQLFACRPIAHLPAKPASERLERIHSSTSSYKIIHREQVGFEPAHVKPSLGKSAGRDGGRPLDLAGSLERRVYGAIERGGGAGASMTDHHRRSIGSMVKYF